MSADPRRTKIVATIGPASATQETLSALVTAGVDAFRMNFSHGTHAQHAEAAKLVRAVQSEHQKALALIADLQGPKLRIGDLPEPRALQSRHAETRGCLGLCGAHRGPRPISIPNLPDGAPE